MIFHILGIRISIYTYISCIEIVANRSVMEEYLIDITNDELQSDKKIELVAEGSTELADSPD